MKKTDDSSIKGKIAMHANNFCHKRGSKKIFDEQWREHPESKTYPRDNPNNIWDLYQKVLGEQILDILSEKLPNPEVGTCMLECGCGTAGMSIFFANHGYTCFVLDASRTSLELARENYLENRKDTDIGFYTVQGDVFHLPFGDNSLEVVSSFGLLEHFEDPYPVILEMVRVLKPEGIFLADIAHGRFSMRKIAGSIHFWTLLFYFTISFNFDRAKYAVRCICPRYYESNLGREEYVKLMKNAGLSDVRILMQRPFAVLPLPQILEQHYVKIIQKWFMPLWTWFDSQDRWISPLMHSIYFAVGRKEGEDEKSPF